MGSRAFASCISSSAWLANGCESAVSPVVKWETVQEGTRVDGRGCTCQPETMSRLKRGPWGLAWACAALVALSAACTTEQMADSAD